MATRIASVCKSNLSNKKTTIKTIDTEISNCNVISDIIKRDGNKMLIDVELNGKSVEFQFDTGAGRSIINLNHLGINHH